MSSYNLIRALSDFSTFVAHLNWAACSPNKRQRSALCAMMSWLHHDRRTQTQLETNISDDHCSNTFKSAPLPAEHTSEMAAAACAVPTSSQVIHHLLGEIFI